MPRAEMDVQTSLSPDRVREALLDFSDKRPETWPGIEPSLYRVVSVGETQADIQEGTKLPGKKVWAVERYDWSQPDKVRWTVMESNFSAAGSYVEATLSPRADGGTDIHLVWSREGTTLLGKMIVRLIALTKGKPVAASLQRGLTRLERAGG